MKFDFTPWPWVISKTDSSIFDTHGQWIADVSGISNSNDGLANARLIACAPEMLEALIFVLKKSYEWDCKIVEIIERATGKKIEDIIK